MKNQPAPPPLYYRLLTFPLLLIWIGHALISSFKHRNIQYLQHRLGLAAPSQAKIWFHAASIGEVELLKHLLLTVAKTHPVLLTTFTPTGFQHARNQLPKQVQVQVIPIDFLFSVKRFFNHNQLQLGLIAETELWPELLYQAHLDNIPLLHINARLSSKSLNRPRWIRQILSSTLQYFEQHLTRSQQDVELIASLSVNRDRIVVCGNLKHAHEPVQSSSDLPRLVDRPYILFASTHAPEEILFAQAIKKLQADLSIHDPAITLAVIAPRHPQRAAEIMKSLKNIGLDIKQRSKGESIDDATQIYLADTLGEMMALYAYSRLVVMGGSFNDIGGHNILEPARLGCCIITGPSDSNIHSDIELFQQHDAIVQVQDADQLLIKLRQLLNEPGLTNELGNNARSVTETQRHVFESYLRKLQPYLDQLS